MQKDFMGMAQQQGVNPQQPGENERANVLQNLIDMATQAKILTSQTQGKIMPELEKLVDLIMAEDQEAVEDNKIYQILMQTLAKAEEMQDTQQAQAQPAATKDFASMMPPAGGGLPGR
jgi:GTPase involved in cell partitioning and DNA repair